MEKKVIFRGVGTALVTPFKDGKIDFCALGKIIELQCSKKIDALIIGGTTAEAATLSNSERYALFEFCKERLDGRAKIIFGTGTNDTKEALRHTRAASLIGCDGVLVVTPYYNKGTKDGIVKHYLQIAEASTAPVLLYNVPSRTGVNLPIESVFTLSEHENIVGIKEAHDSLERLVELSALGDRLTLYAGSDSAIYTALMLGGGGVISVISNAYPALTRAVFEKFDEGDFGGALRAQILLLPMIRAIFAETNPSPIKYVMEALGLIGGELRLPLDTVTAATAARLDFEMGRINEP